MTAPAAPDLIFAAVETGGTKTLCRVAAADGAVLAEGRWATVEPQAMLEALAEFIEAATPAGARLAGLGVAAFGPLLVDPDDPDRGRMLNTPKPGWSGTNLSKGLGQRLRVPVAVDTDVNAAALAEQRLGAGRGLSSVAYVTVGTGIGGGLFQAGRTLTGALHPEIGHIRLARAAGDGVASCCPFHPDCAEGLAAGPAIARRLGPGRPLSDDPQAMALVADYLGQLMATLVFAWAPQRIVLGGGVMGEPGLIQAVAGAMGAVLGDYGVGPAARAPDFLVPAMLENAGLEGALLMARFPPLAKSA